MRLFAVLNSRVIRGRGARLCSLNGSDDGGPGVAFARAGGEECDNVGLIFAGERASNALSVSLALASGDRIFSGNDSS